MFWRFLCRLLYVLELKSNHSVGKNIPRSSVDVNNRDKWEESEKRTFIKGRKNFPKAISFYEGNC